MGPRREIDFAESSSWWGKWWDPRYSHERFPGELSYSPDGGVRLEFFDTDGDISAQVKHLADHRFIRPVIHGYANSTPATLIDAHLWNSSDSTSMTEGRIFRQYEYKAEGLVLGAHLEDRTAKVLSCPTFGAEQAAHWVGDRPQTDEDGRREQWHVEEHSYSAVFGDHTLELSPWLPSRTSGDTGLGIHDETLLSRNFTITGPPMSYNELMEKQRLVLQLLSLATDSAPKLTHSQATVAQSEQEARETSDYMLPSAHLVQPVPRSTSTSGRRRRIYEFAFTLEDVQFHELIPKWVEMNENLGGSLRILMGNRYLERPVLDSLLLSIVAAAEAIHSKLDPDPPKDPGSSKAVKAQILAGTPEEHKERISSTFTNSYSLKARFVRLMERLPPELMRFNWTSRGIWMKVAHKARNDISHSGTSEIHAQDIYDAYEEIEELLLINLLFELGVPVERIDEWMLRRGSRKLHPRWDRRRREG